MSDVEIQGSRALVTGAGSGIGRATALRFARDGAEVVCVDIDGDTAAATAEACGAEGKPGQPYVCDVSDGGAVADLAESVESEQGAVDILVNNAGVGIAGPFLESELSDWEWLRGVNLDGVVNGCHVFGARMAEREYGHIVNVASGAGYIANRNMAAYCASKSAVIMLTQCLRADWSGSGVGASVVCPGVINTPIAAATRFVGRAAAKQERAVRAMRRGHSPDIVAKAITEAIERDRAIVPVGIESTLAYRLLRLAPGPVQGLVARTQIL